MYVQRPILTIFRGRTNISIKYAVDETRPTYVHDVNNITRIWIGPWKVQSATKKTASSGHLPASAMDTLARQTVSIWMYSPVSRGAMRVKEIEHLKREVGLSATSE